MPQAVRLVIDGMGDERSGSALMSSGGAGLKAHDEFVVDVIAFSVGANKQPDDTRPSEPTVVAMLSKIVPGGKT